MPLPIQQGIQSIHPPRRIQSVKPVQNIAGKENNVVTTISEANQLMERKLYEKLEAAILESGGVAIEKTTIADYTPQAVADRILSFVGGAVSLARQEHGQEKADEVLSAARAGIEKGFQEAKSILEGLNLFSNDIEKNALTTYDLLLQGLDKFNEPDAISSQGVVTETAFNSERELKIAIETTEGDIVEVAFANSRHISTKSTESESSYNSDHSDSFRYQITGDISQAESVAIENLLSDITPLVDSFFSGDAADSYVKAKQLGYDAETISSYALSLKDNQTNKYAQAYERVEYIGNSNVNMSNSILPSIKEFMNKLAAAINSVEDTMLFTHPGKMATESFAAIAHTDETKSGLAAAFEQNNGESLSTFADQLNAAIQNRQTQA